MDNQIKLTALPEDELRKLLVKSGSQTATCEEIGKDIENGAPVNPDGTVNLVAYAAWLMKQRTEETDD